MRKFCVLAAVISALSAPAFGQCPAKFVPYKVTFGTSLKEAQRTVAQHPRFLGAKMRDRKKGFALSVAREGFREELSVAAHIATADGEGDRLAAIVYAVSRRFRYRAANAPGLAATYKAAIDQFGPPSSEGAPKRKAR
ncbi:MAG: hypothetical protein MRY74_03290, partial [Neomegalonema sp.]|nr:hypothetical protein [Neomegalonema sp.]